MTLETEVLCVDFLRSKGWIIDKANRLFLLEANNGLWTNSVFLAVRYLQDRLCYKFQLMSVTPEIEPCQDIGV